MTDPRRFVVVGAGGTGGHLIRGLAPMLEYGLQGSVLVIVDGDSFEPSNAERQDFTDMGNKAVVRAVELQPRYPNTFIVPDERWVVAESPKQQDDDPDNPSTEVGVHDLLVEGDVVYAVVDNFATRKLLFDAARDYQNIDIFSGGNDDNLFGSTYHYQRRDGRDVSDHPGDYHPEFVDPPDRNPGEMSCQERAKIESSTQLLATNMAVAALLLARTHKVILKKEEDAETEIMFDLGLGLSQAYNRRVDALANTNS